MADINAEIVKARIALSNITKADYDIGDYKMCKSESEVVIKALNCYIDDLKGQNVTY